MRLLLYWLYWLKSLEMERWCGANHHVATIPNAIACLPECRLDDITVPEDVYRTTWDFQHAINSISWSNLLTIEDDWNAWYAPTKIPLLLAQIFACNESFFDGVLNPFRQARTKLLSSSINSRSFVKIVSTISRKQAPKTRLCQALYESFLKSLLIATTLWLPISVKKSSTSWISTWSVH